MRRPRTRPAPLATIRYQLAALVIASFCLTAADTKDTQELVWVNASGPEAACSSPCGATRSSPCPSIRCALEQAADEATLRLLPGRYVGDDNVGISSGNVSSTRYGADDDPGTTPAKDGAGASRLSILGAGPGATVVSCEGSSFDFFLVARGAFLRALANLTVTQCRGLALLNATAAPSVVVSDAHFTNHTPAKPLRANGTGIYAAGGAGASLILERVLFSGLSALAGGALTVSGAMALIVRDTNFSFNGIAGGGGEDGGGGAIQATSAGAVYLLDVDTAEFEGCRFTGNRAQQQGGALRAGISAASARDATSNSNDDDGGAPQLVFRRTVFEDNGVAPGESCAADSSSCEASGGAAFVQAAAAAFHGCTFRRNFVTAYRLSGGRGGALYVAPPTLPSSSTSTSSSSSEALSAYRVLLEDSDLSENAIVTVPDSSGGCRGGAVFASYLTLTVRGTTLSFNKVNYDTSKSQGSAIYSTTTLSGGALSCTTVALRVANSTLLQNSVASGGSGGALFLDATTAANVSGSRFEGNVVVSSYFRLALGGAVIAQNDVRLRLSDSVFLYNAAVRCSQAQKANTMSTSSSSSSLATGQQESGHQYASCMSGSGGAVAVLGSSLFARNASFLGNEAEAGGLDTGSSGGAVALTDTLRHPVAFDGCTFGLNAARGAPAGPLSTHGSAGRGGAVAVVSGAPYFAATRFEMNWAEGAGRAPAFGGAVAVAFSDLAPPHFGATAAAPSSFAADYGDDDNNAGADPHFAAAAFYSAFASTYFSAASSSSSSSTSASSLGRATHFFNSSFVKNHACSLNCRLDEGGAASLEASFGVAPLLASSPLLAGFRHRHHATSTPPLEAEVEVGGGGSAGTSSSGAGSVGFPDAQSGQGGAVAVSMSDVVAELCRLHGNVAYSGRVAPGIGGALYLAYAGSLVVRNSSLLNNSIVHPHDDSSGSSDSNSFKSRSNHDDYYFGMHVAVATFYNQSISAQIEHGVIDSSCRRVVHRQLPYDQFRRQSKCWDLAVFGGDLTVKNLHRSRYHSSSDDQNGFDAAAAADDDDDDEAANGAKDLDVLQVGTSMVAESAVPSDVVGSLSGGDAEEMMTGSFIFDTSLTSQMNLGITSVGGTVRMVRATAITSPSYDDASSFSPPSSSSSSSSANDDGVNPSEGKLHTLMLVNSVFETCCDVFIGQPGNTHAVFSVSGAKLRYYDESQSDSTNGNLSSSSSSSSSAAAAAAGHDCYLPPYESHRTSNDEGDGDDGDDDDGLRICPRLQLYGATRFGRIEAWVKLSTAIAVFRKILDANPEPGSHDFLDKVHVLFPDWTKYLQTFAGNHVMGSKLIFGLSRAIIDSEVAAGDAPIAISGLRVAMLNGMAALAESAWDNTTTVKRLRHLPFFEQEISAAEILLSNSRFLLSGGSVLFVFSHPSLEFRGIDEPSGGGGGGNTGGGSEVVLEGDVYLEDYESVPSTLSKLINCGRSSNPNGDDDALDFGGSGGGGSSEGFGWDSFGGIGQNATATRLILNCTARQTKQSQIKIEALKRGERAEPSIVVADAAQWEGEVNLTNALPHHSVMFEPTKVQKQQAAGGDVKLKEGKSYDWNVYIRSRWAIINFLRVDDNSTGNATASAPNMTVTAPDGVTMTWDTELVGPDSYRGFAFVTNLSCDQALAYSNNPAGNGAANMKEEDYIMMNCSLCLLNSSCQYNDHYSQIQPFYGCTDKAGSGDSAVNKGSDSRTCCEDDCNMHELLPFWKPAGKCVLADSREWYNVECQCNLWWDGDGCKDVSNGAWVLYLVSLFVLAALLASCVLTLYYKYTLREVREEHERVLDNLEQDARARLQEQLLGGVGGRGGGVDGHKNGLSADEIRRITKGLVLKDVEVPFEQIKVEKLIGEGGIGVVYKAKFRSAPVALKLIKTPYHMAMDQEELERFRAEAYLMSRLRHPNLVLIMGVTQFFADKHTIPDSAGVPMRGFTVGDKAYGIISEYLNRGSLADVLYGESMSSTRGGGGGGGGMGAMGAVGDGGGGNNNNKGGRRGVLGIHARGGSVSVGFFNDIGGSGDSSNRGHGDDDNDYSGLGSVDGSGVENPLLATDNNGGDGGPMMRRERSLSTESEYDQFREKWNYELVLSSALQAARGLLFLHSQTPPIVHRDVKCSNLVIDDRFVVKITDFGMSRLLPQQMEERALTDGTLDFRRSFAPTVTSVGTADGFFGRMSGFGGNGGGGDEDDDDDDDGNGNGNDNDNDNGNGDGARSEIEEDALAARALLRHENGTRGLLPQIAATDIDAALDSEAEAAQENRRAQRAGRKANPKTNNNNNNNDDDDDDDGPVQDGLEEDGGDASIGTSSHSTASSLRGKRSGGSGGGPSLSGPNANFPPGNITMTSNVGTVAWMAPEINAGAFEHTSYSLPVDVYSFGMVLYELAERRAPFAEDTSRFDIMDKVRQGQRPEITAELLLSEEHPGYRKLMEKCWDQKPELRPTMGEVVEILEDLYVAERQNNREANLNGAGGGVGGIGYNGGSIGGGIDMGGPLFAQQLEQHGLLQLPPQRHSHGLEHLGQPPNPRGLSSQWFGRNGGGGDGVTGFDYEPLSSGGAAARGSGGRLRGFGFGFFGGGGGRSFASRRRGAQQQAPREEREIIANEENARRWRQSF